jgi:hypothetical protein
MVQPQVERSRHLKTHADFSQPMNGQAAADA